MPAGRFLSKTVATDEPLNQLSWQAQAVYMMTVPHLDRDGLITGHPLLLMAQVAPLRAAELVGIMAGLIKEWIDADLVVCYHDNGQPVLFFPGFLKHQRLPHYDRETPSEFAPPPGYERTENGIFLVEEPVTGITAVSPASLPTDSAATPDLLRTQSGVGPPIKQQREEESKNPRNKHEKSSSSSITRPRARPSPPAAAARGPGQIKPEIYDALQQFGVAEPALSELSSNGFAPEHVGAWIDYLGTQTNMRNPVGYLVKRLRAHEPPPIAAAAEEPEPDSYEALKRRYVPEGWQDVVKH